MELSNNYTTAMALVVLVLAYKNLPWVWHVSDSPVFSLGHTTHSSLSRFDLFELW